ncbi:methyltransferase family protein [Marinibactrum halimedae]|uniref:DUF1295 domain-containing protein n=1 Tax=Marinibactrum halimedae TaxID=1444977 RepID=A0AA37SZV2_9GAMM|nr:isoprenylcysteine carboxylmethyltransferase family protein [Marinibactrum halimedae]MCD9460654.1 DUF1295 domain-containing protein [Marinibactrum halimedae]GLS24299.1 hypothetical protein GCM10007877_00100 [Marinibactrum halimedae]
MLLTCPSHDKDTINGVSKIDTPPKKTSVQERQRWITDRAWVTGLIGAISVFLIAAVYSYTNIFQQGLILWGISINGRHALSLFALFIIIVMMVSCEIVRLVQFYSRTGKSYLSLSPLLYQKKYFQLILSSIVLWGGYLLLLQCVIALYHTANEYGYKNAADYYQVWFFFLEILWKMVLWAGLPYVLITRSFQHNPHGDQKDLAVWLVKLCGLLLFLLLKLFKNDKGFRFISLSAAHHVVYYLTFQASLKWNQQDNVLMRGLVVKLFFAPLMTVFFNDQFYHLVSNIDYLTQLVPKLLTGAFYSHAQLNQDVFNISVSAIFSIDVALAWCGYVVSMRWLDNQNHSVEPSMLGWLVCLCCYPPFQMIQGFYYSVPSDKMIFQFDHQMIISVLIVLMVLSYVVYMISTLMFGVRFSNLTHRGIIRTGPYAWVRHPAYASKNFAWWCIMCPIIVLNISTTGFGLAIIQMVGLVMQSTLYYLRAITEEKHLSQDPLYREYCKRVPNRFIPQLHLK